MVRARLNIEPDHDFLTSPQLSELRAALHVSVGDTYALLVYNGARVINMHATGLVRGQQQREVHVGYSAW